MEKALNKKGFPHFEAVAPTGEGVFKTLKMISKMVLEEIRKNKMGSPNAVKTQQPKPDPVAVSPSGTTSDSQTAAKEQPAQPKEAGGEMPPSPSEGGSEANDASESTDDEPAPLQKENKPGIMEDSETLANVVVSDSQNLPDAAEDGEMDDDMEETTERAVLKETTLDDREEHKAGSTPGSDYEEVEDQDSESGGIREPLYNTGPEDQNFDEESTQISDLSLKNPLPLGKPQMAESRKVKNKHRKFGLLGIFKKSKK